MTIEYELISVYSTSDVTIVKEKIGTLFEDSFVEIYEVADLAKQYNTVILYELTESTGYSEVLLINNLGDHIEGVNYCLDDIAVMRQEFKTKSILESFDPVVKKKISNHMNAHKIKESEFTEEYLDELFLDNYETTKERLRTTLKDYFIK